MARRVAVLAIAVLFASTLLTISPASATGKLPPTEWVIGPDEKVAMLVFDGHEKPSVLRSLLKRLSRLDAPASFFMSGRWVHDHKSLARSIVQDGHVLGNRGYGKKTFTKLSSSKLRNSIERATAVLRKVKAWPRPFLRAPRGVRDLDVLRVAGSLGYRSVRWTHHPGGGSSEEVADAVMNRLMQGSIISLDIRRVSHRNAIGEIVAGLSGKGFRLQTIEALQGTHAIRHDVSVGVGSSGEQVRYLQQRLNALHYPAGQVDGAFGDRTLQAVYAFQKVRGLGRDGNVSPGEMTLLATGRRPHVRDRKARRYIEVDISRQVLFEVRRGRVFKVLPVSSGNEEFYKQDGVTYKAHTPRGKFVIERKIPGWRISRLGKLWYPSYFIGGYAIHGSPSVPPYPASHGCVRIPMWLAKKFYKRTPVGMKVFVHD